MHKAGIAIYNFGHDYKHELEQLKVLGIDAEYIPLEGTNEAKVIGAALKGCDFVLAGHELWSDEAFEAVGPQLKLVARLGVGVDRVDIAAATRRGVAICNAPGGNACSVAQHTLALMMSLLMKITRYDRLIRNGMPYKRTMTCDLIGKTIGLVGFGRISAQLAKLLSGFGCTILAYDVCKNHEIAAPLGVQFVELDELLAVSDCVSLHLPLTESTFGMANLQFFKRMKRGAFFVNSARSKIVHEPDLIYALKTGLIAGAGLDVYEEPLAENGLLLLDNVIITPYVAFASELGVKRTSDMAIDCIRSYLQGKPPENLLNPDYIGYVVR